MTRNRLIIGSVVIIVVAIAAIFIYPYMTASAATSTRVQTVPVQRGTLTATVDAAGNVVAPEQASLAFQTTGAVTLVNVKVGDQVKKGQLLMQVDPTALNLALQNAQAGLATAQSNYQAAQYKDSQNPQQAIVAKAALDQATIALQTAQQNYNAVAYQSNVGMLPQAAALQTATSNYQSALATYNIAISNLNHTALDAAKASLDQAQVAVNQAQNNLDQTKVVAPFDGSVATVNYAVGDMAGTTAAVVLTNLANLQIDATMAEVDVVNIKVGQTAQLTMDALPGSTYNAKVAELGPVGTVTQGVVNYPVTFDITNNDGKILPGMTANLAVDIAQHNDVLIVPTRAVHTQGNQKTVTVLYKNQQITVPVSTGLTNNTSVEITQGLNEGDLVVLNPTTTTAPRVGGGGGGLFLGGGR